MGSPARAARGIVAPTYCGPSEQHPYIFHHEPARAAIFSPCKRKRTAWKG